MGGMSNRETPYEDLPEYLTPAEVRAYLHLSRGTVYELLRSNQIGHVRFGRTIRIPKSALRTTDGATPVLR
jgi:excisionase family DNA binding protein